MPEIEVYADIWCPFAHVGLRTAAERLVELAGGPPAGARSEAVLRVRAWPLELVNGAPQDPAATARHVEELRDRVAPGLFRSFDPGRFPSTTLPALALAARAYRTSPATGLAVSLALRRALFEEGADIGDPDVLTTLGRAHGVRPTDGDDDSAVLEDWHRGEGLGVRGSPHFFCGSRDVFCPLLRMGEDPDGQLTIELQFERLEHFLRACLSGADASGPVP